MCRPVRSGPSVDRVHPETQYVAEVPEGRLSAQGCPIPFGMPARTRKRSVWPNSLAAVRRDGDLTSRICSRDPFPPELVCSLYNSSVYTAARQNHGECLRDILVPRTYLEQL